MFKCQNYIFIFIPVSALRINPGLPPMYEIPTPGEKPVVAKVSNEKGEYASLCIFHVLIYFDFLCGVCFLCYPGFPHFLKIIEYPKFCP